jgi:diketogulonate reductase-like aldo/keto reductase
MERRPFGPVPREAAVIGQGTWYIDDAHRPTAVAALRRGLDLGMTHIDTAEVYGDAEDVVGEAIAGRREELFLVSKVMPSNASRDGTVTACERWLARLRTDRLDCYLLHWPGPHPLEDAFAGFERLLRVLEDIAASHGATARQVALRFLVRRPSTFTIPKASNPEHAADNAGAGALQLTEAELARIDTALPLGLRPPRLPML